MRYRNTHRSEAKHNPGRDLEVAVRACEVPGLPIADHYAVVLGEILG